MSDERISEKGSEIVALHDAAEVNVLSRPADNCSRWEILDGVFVAANMLFDRLSCPGMKEAVLTVEVSVAGGRMGKGLFLAATGS